jgi:hypothetical protein
MSKTRRMQSEKLAAMANTAFSDPPLSAIIAANQVFLNMSRTTYNQR